MSMNAIRSSVLVALLAPALLLLPARAMAQTDDSGSDLDYRPGKGWLIGSTGLSLGGYASIAYQDLEASPATFSVSDLSLFVHWEGEGKLRLFAELDLEDPLVYTPGQGGPRTSQSYVALERLYGDYLYADGLNFRVGKFLTPIGRWNEIHADPLVWTTSRPLVTERSFPTNATGAMVFGTLPVFGKPVDYQIYSALGEDWRPDPKLDPFEEAYGIHVSVPVSASTELGFSYVSFEQKASIGERRKLIGLDYSWSHNRYEVSAEAICRLSDEGSSLDEKGMFVQGVAPLTGRLYAVARFEIFDPAGPDRPVRIGLAGLALKFTPAFVFKLEYRQASRRQSLAPDGLMTSVSILF